MARVHVYVNDARKRAYERVLEDDADAPSWSQLLAWAVDAQLAGRATAAGEPAAVRGEPEPVAG